MSIKRYLTGFSTLALMAGFSAPLLADDHAAFELHRLSVGGAITQNVIDSPFDSSSDDAAGINIFAAYQLNQHPQDIHSSVELGYAKTGEFSGVDDDIAGLWLAMVAEKPLPEIDNQLSALIRLGLDLGDDDGLFLGAGLGYKIDPQVQLRGEFINKDASTVYQIGASYSF